MLRELKLLSEASEAPGLPGSLYSFVPAHGGSRAGAVAEQLSRALAEGPESYGFGLSVLLADFGVREYSPWTAGEGPRRLDGRTWGALVSSSNGLDVLDPREVHPRQLRQVLDYARQKYGMIFADLTFAKEAHALETLRASDSIFLVSDSDLASLEMVREKAEWLSSMDLIDHCGLLMRRVNGGAKAANAERITGLPLCSLLDNDDQVKRLARWVAAQERVLSTACA